MRLISEALYLQLKRLGLMSEGVRNYNVGKSNYSKHIIQPWSIWLDYNLNPWDADIVKRVLRTKEGESRKLDYEKIIHICQERIRQLEEENEYKYAFIKKGILVYWDDPAIEDFPFDEKVSQMDTVWTIDDVKTDNTEIQDDTIVLISNQYSTAEVFAKELIPVI
jgi:hypothetical protein